MFTDGATADRSTLRRCHRPSNGSCDGTGCRSIRFHDLRHTHATLLIDAGVPAKVVAERLGHATRVSFTIETYQHVLPGMQADAARVLRATRRRVRLLPDRPNPVEDPEEVSLNTVEAGPKGPASQPKLVAGAGFEPATFGL